MNSSIDPNMSICLSEEDRDGNRTPQNYEYVTQRSTQTNMETAKIVSQFDKFKEEMRQLITYFTNTHKDEIADIKAAISDIQQTNLNIATSVASLTAQNEDLKNQITFLEQNLKEERQYIVLLESRMEDMQMTLRKTNFEIKNVPKKPNESKQDLVEMVTCLAESLTCPIARSEIKDIYRVRGNKPDQKNTPIVVETTSALIKADILKRGKLYNAQTKYKLTAKQLGFKTQEDTPVFLSEHLTAKGSRLHYLARDLAKSKGYRFCWTNYGKVYVRKNEQSPIILIRSEEQVHHLLLGD